MPWIPWNLLGKITGHWSICFRVKYSTAVFAVAQRGQSRTTPVLSQRSPAIITPCAGKRINFFCLDQALGVFLTFCMLLPRFVSSNSRSFISRAAESRTLLRNTNRNPQIHPTGRTNLDDDSLQAVILHSAPPKRAVNEVGYVEQGGTNGLENREVTRD